MSDYTVSGDLGDMPDKPNGGKPKRTRQGQIPIDKIIDDYIKPLNITDPKLKKRVVKELKDVLNVTYGRAQVEYQSKLDSVRNLLGQFGINGTRAGTFITNLKKITNSKDTDSVKLFDEMVDLAEKYHQDVLGMSKDKSSDNAQRLATALMSNYPKRPNKRDLVGDAFVESGLSNKDHPVYQEAVKKSRPKKMTPPAGGWDEGSGSFPDDDDAYSASFDISGMGSLAPDPPVVTPTIWDEGSGSFPDSDDDYTDTSFDFGGIDSPSSTSTAAVDSLDSLAHNDPFVPGAAGTPKATRSKANSDDAARLDKLKYSTIESIVSQIMSRVVGTSFYPVVTALRAAREVSALETGEEMGIGDILNFSADSGGKLLNKVVDALGLGNLAGKLGIGGSSSTSTFESINESISKLVDSVEEHTVSVDEATETINEVVDDLSDLAENAQFGMGGGRGGGGGGFNDPPNAFDEEPEDDDKELTPAQLIAGMVALFAGGAVAKHITDKTVSQLGAVASDQMSYLSKTVPNIISNPSGVSGVGMAGQPVKAAIGAAGAFGAPIGGVVGAKLGGALAGTAIGKTLGATVGTTLGGPILGTLIGQYVGGLIGDIASSTAGSVVSLLQSIDEGISSLAGDLTPFSPELAQATAVSEIEKLQAKMQQAEVLGPMLAQNVEAKTDFESALRGVGTELALVMTPIMTDIYSVLTPILSEIRKGMAFGNVLLAVVRDLAELQKELITRTVDFTPTIGAIRNYLDAINNNTRPQGALLDQLDAFINPANPMNQQQMRGQVGAFGAFPII